MLLGVTTGVLGLEDDDYRSQGKDQLLRRKKGGVPGPQIT